MGSDLAKVYKKLKKFTKVYKKIDLSKKCTFQIGGRAKIFAEPGTVEELLKILNVLKTYNVKYVIIGNASNILFNSSDFDGVVIKMSRFNHYEIHGTKVIADAGVNLSQLIKDSVNHGLSGLEDGYLIPATVGGAVRMNASAFQFSTGENISSVLALVDGKIRLYSKEDCQFGYKSNVFKDGDIILRAQFDLFRGDKKQLQTRLKEIIELRKLKINNTPSAGCIFKNPKGYSAGQLIENAGFKGYKLGGAMVSENHANIIYNVGGATSDDVKTLIRIITEKVKDLYNIELEMEIKNY